MMTAIQLIFDGDVEEAIAKSNHRKAGLAYSLSLNRPDRIAGVDNISTHRQLAGFAQYFEHSHYKGLTQTIVSNSNCLWSARRYNYQYMKTQIAQARMRRYTQFAEEILL